MNTASRLISTGSSSSGSLILLRVVAALGAIAAGFLVVVAFRFNLWIGLASLLAAPALPLAIVVAIDGLRSR